MKHATHWSRAALCAAALTFTTPAFAQTPPAPPPPAAADAPVPPPPVDGPSQTVAGTVDGYNRDPRGQVNSVVVKAGDRLAQFNLPPDLGQAAAAAAPVGQPVTAVGVAEVSVGGRTIYRLSQLTGPDGKAMAVPLPGATPLTVHVEGTVARLNVAPRGEVDGAVLDGGDFVHTGPAAGAALAVGAKLSADGPARPMPDGHRAVDATRVNGVAVPRPPRPPHGPGGERPAPPPPPR